MYRFGTKPLTLIGKEEGSLQSYSYSDSHVKTVGQSNTEKLSYLVYSLFLLSLYLAPQLSQNVPAIAGFLCGKAVVLRR